MASLDNSIAEITLIGTGGGYGESIVIHFGNQNWVVIDSCINPENKQSLPLEYLQELGVNIKTDVKLILCTHWHDDHILGISQLYKECHSADFSFSRVNDLKKFLQFVSLDFQKDKKINKTTTISSTTEFSKCLDVLKERNKTPILCCSDRLINSHSTKEWVSELFSLSPSDSTILNYDKEISTLISEYGKQNEKITFKKPNDKSVAVFVKIGSHRAILGADLEVTPSNDDGWLNIIEYSKVIDKKSGLFKIPHHGSENGYHDNIFDKLLLPNPISKLTPWSRNQKLPNQEMVTKYKSKSSALYITSNHGNNNPKKREKSIEKMIKIFNKRVTEVKFNKGLIRSRIEINNPDATWKIEMLGSAIKL